MYLVGRVLHQWNIYNEIIIYFGWKSISNKKNIMVIEVMSSVLQRGVDGQVLYTKGVSPTWDNNYEQFNITNVTDFDLTQIDEGCCGFSDAVFDGKNIYLCPSQTGSLFVSHDMSALISNVDSYQTKNLTTVNVHLVGLTAIVYDNHRYIYFIPGNTVNAYACRYDTSYGDITNGAAYTVFNVGTVGEGCTGFGAGLFDGRYVYFLPDGTSSMGMRYDTRAAFTSTDSYSTIDFSDVVDVVGFMGAACDGRYVYMATYNAENQTGIVVVYDMSEAFDDSDSYIVFDLATMNSSAVGFRKCCVNDKYVYFAPASNGLAVRLDTTKDMETADAYTIFNMQHVNIGLTMATACVCSGKYVYYCFAGTCVARYDTSKSFANVSAWSYVDMVSVSVNCSGFTSMICDDEYVYCIPYARADEEALSGFLTRVFIGNNNTSIRNLNDVRIIQQTKNDLLVCQF